ncbi:MAG: guanylate kinase [Acidobacteria bacterium]|nr:guanylate kinase [Acidobacteriota bacterium]
MSSTGTLFVVSGPSGAGKTTLAKWAIAEIPNLRYSVSYTSRPPRAGERPGLDYFFVGVDEFQRMIAADAFLEWAQVYGNYYGTHRPATEAMLANGCDIIMDIDVQGARSLRRKCDNALLVFIFPPTFQTLMQRIVDRNLDSEETIRRRMAMAKAELSAYDQYEYLVVNDDLAQAQLELKSIVIAQRCRRSAREHCAQSLLQSLVP